MRRIFSYILVTTVSLLFIFHSSEIESKDTTAMSILSGEPYFAGDYSNYESENQIQSGSSDKGKSFTFCRYGSNAQSFHLVKEKQYFSTGSFISPVLSAFVQTSCSLVFTSFDTHIPDRLKSLLYPKHSFW